MDETVQHLLPPDSSVAFANKHLALETGIIPTDPYTIIAGDFNAHSLLWDDIQPPDTRGTEMENWIIDQELSVANDGSPTRVGRITGNESTPMSPCVETSRETK